MTPEKLERTNILSKRIDRLKDQVKKLKQTNSYMDMDHFSDNQREVLFIVARAIADQNLAEAEREFEAI
jgi:hypothetical protein